MVIKVNLSPNAKLLYDYLCLTSNSDRRMLLDSKNFCKWFDEHTESRMTTEMLEALIEELCIEKIRVTNKLFSIQLKNSKYET